MGYYVGLCMSRSKCIVAWEAGMNWEKVKVGYSKSVLIVFCVGGCWGKKELGQSGSIVFALLPGIKPAFAWHAPL